MIKPKGSKTGYEYKVLSSCELSREVRAILKYLGSIENNMLFLNKKVNKLETEIAKLKWKKKRKRIGKK